MKEFLLTNEEKAKSAIANAKQLTIEEVADYAINEILGYCRDYPQEHINIGLNPWGELDVRVSTGNEYETETVIVTPIFSQGYQWREWEEYQVDISFNREAEHSEALIKKFFSNAQKVIARMNILERFETDIKKFYGVM